MTDPSPRAAFGVSRPLPQGEREEQAAAVNILTHAKSMRSAMTDAEAALWRILRAKRLEAFKFRRQQPIGPFIADFVCYSERLIIEADGSQHADSEADQRRTMWLSGQNFRVMRFWNAEILTRPDDVARTIYIALTDPSPRAAFGVSRPLPRGEREESGDYGV